MCYRSTIRWVVLIAVLFCPPPLDTPVSGDEGNAPSDWRIGVAANKDSRGEWQLDIAMEYLGEKPVELPDREIPWKWPYAMCVCGVHAREFLSSPLSLHAPAGDPPKGLLAVKPGETLKGAIPLRSLFDSWSIRRWFGEPVIVFWSYKPQGSNRVGGWLEIPRENDSSEKKSNVDGEEWKVKVSVKKASRAAWKWNIAIEYHGKTDTYLQNCLLPWAWPQSMIVCAVSANGQSQLVRRSETIDDPPEARMKVKPGDIIRGEITRYFDDMVKEPRRSPVIVFWSYKVKTSKRVGGWFEVEAPFGSGKEKEDNRRGPVAP